ncbi:hypothetical protein [Pandoraea soli]|uniref:Uncharacterized protein n=1 Tax=Pandoraea soli TaxID=2508293 RepID=A0ABY6W8A0_9BURK|nr:hypothetical protein [Pandoraea soli]VVE33131.1 hypothetical protein PSO31014_03742 [Pandoraea soli]
MIDRISGTPSPSRAYTDVAGQLRTKPTDSQNPLLSTIGVASDQLTTLQSMADAWLAQAQTRINVARDARDFATVVGEMAQRASLGSTPEGLPPALRDFAIRHELLSPQSADEPFDAAGLQTLEAQLQSLAMIDSASSTREQIQLKRFVTRYDNTLTLYNAVIAKLGEIMKKIVNSI